MRPAALTVILVAVAAACVPQSAAPSPSGTASQSPTSTATSLVPQATATPVPSSTPIDAAAPASAGAVADAGVLFVQGADDRIYGYDGATGSLEAVWGKSTFGPAAAVGVYAIGRHGGAELLGWDGTTTEIPCGSGYAVSVTAGGACASVGVDGVYAKLRYEQAPRLILPADWGAGAPSWSLDGRRLLLVRQIRPRPGPGMDPGLAALWLMEADGSLHEVYRPSGQGLLVSPIWSPDGTKVVVWRVGSTSASFAADGVAIDALLVDVPSGAVRVLGTVLDHAWAAWAPDGRLAFVRGGGRQTWWNKELVVLEVDGSEHGVPSIGDGDRVAIAPAWSSGGRLAWVSGPAVNDYNGGHYVDGRGGGQRVGVVDEGGRLRTIACGDGRVAEGIRWSADAEKLLLLCRVPGGAALPLELWLYRLTDGTSAPLVRGLPSDPLAGGFGFYGRQPSITAVAAWSLATSPWSASASHADARRR